MINVNMKGRVNFLKFYKLLGNEAVTTIVQAHNREIDTFPGK
jgi:hypothetical protein